MSIIVTCECGKQYRVQDQFSGRHANCPACGNVLHIPDSPPPPAASTTLLQPRSRRPLIIGIGGGFAALVIIVIVVVWMWPSGNESNQSSQGNRLDQQVAKVPQRSKSEPNAPKKPQVIVSDKQVDQIPSRSKSEPDAPKKPLGPTMAQAETRTQWSTWRPKEPEAMALEILACLKSRVEMCSLANEALESRKSEIRELNVSSLYLKEIVFIFGDPPLTADKGRARANVPTSGSGGGLSFSTDYIPGKENRWDWLCLFDGGNRLQQVEIDLGKLREYLKTNKEAREFLHSKTPPSKGDIRWANEALVENDMYASFRACEIAEAGGPRAIGALEKLQQLLKSDKPVLLKRYAAKAIGALGPGASVAIPDLIAMSNDSEIMLARASIKVMGCFGDESKKALPVLKRFLSDKNKRYVAVSALVQMGHRAKPLVDDLIKLLEAKHYVGMVAEILGAIGKPAARAVPIMQEIIDKPERKEKRGSITYIFVTANKEDVEKLKAAVEKIKKSQENETSP